MQYPVTTATGTGLDREVRSVYRGLDDIIPDVLYLLPKCDEEITIRKTLCEAAQQFCRDTGCFQYTTTIALVNDTKRYLLDCPWPAFILSVKEVRQNIISSTNQVNTSTVYHQNYTIEDPIEDDGNYINLANAINVTAPVTATLEADLIIVPVLDEMIGTQATALPDKFLARWRAAFVSGAVYRLAGMDNKGWTNKALAADARSQYLALQGEAAYKAQLSNMRQGGHTCLPQIGFF